MENNSVNDDIICMKEARQNLERLIGDASNIDEYINILNSIINYLSTHCNHTLIDDFIDIDHDTTKHIRYCKHCELTFE